MVSDYSLNFFKTVVINHIFYFYPRTVVGNYGFNFLNKFKTIVINYRFDDMIRRDLFGYYFETLIILRNFFFLIN